MIFFPLPGHHLAQWPLKRTITPTKAQPRILQGRVLSLLLGFRRSGSVFSLFSPAPPAPGPACLAGIPTPFPEAKAPEGRIHLSVVLFGLEGVCFVLFFSSNEAIF